MRSKFKRVSVFCGSQSGNREVFGDAALALGDELVCCSCLQLYIFIDVCVFLLIRSDSSTLHGVALCPRLQAHARKKEMENYYTRSAFHWIFLVLLIT